MLELSNITKTFNAHTDASLLLYDDLNLKVAEGEFVVVIGSNGSGKSTLLNLVCGQITPDFGSIVFQDQNLQAVKSFQRFRETSRVYQDPSMGTSPSLTVFENLSMADKKGKLFNLQPTLKKQKRAHYIQQLTQLNLGLENKLDVKVSTLSGGQRQAISLLMALLNQPQLLLLDEHTAALDPKNSELIMELTDKLVQKHKITTIMVTHNLQHALDYGTRLVMFHKGKIIADYNNEEKQRLTRSDLANLFINYDGLFQGNL